MSKYRISDFCHFVEVAPGLSALYNSLTLGVMFIGNTACEIFSKAPGKIFEAGDMPFETLKAMEERRLIFPVGRRDDLADYQKMHNLLRDNGIAILYLLVADGCNLACRYCYIENSLPKDYQFSLMTNDVSDRALDLFSRNLSDAISEPKVVLYGGEPLLNKLTVNHAISEFARYKAEGKLPDIIWKM